MRWRDRRRGHVVARPVVLIAEIDRERAADDRLDAGTGELFREFERTEHVVGVGERQRRLVVGFGEFRQPRDGQRAFQQRIRRMDMQVHEAGAGHQVLTNLYATTVRISGARCPPSTHRPREPCALSAREQPPARARRAAELPISRARDGQSVAITCGPRSTHHSDKQRQRGQRGGFFNKRADHVLPPQKNEGSRT